MKKCLVILSEQESGAVEYAHSIEGAISAHLGDAQGVRDFVRDNGTQYVCLELCERTFREYVQTTPNEAPREMTTPNMFLGSKLDGTVLKSSSGWDASCSLCDWAARRDQRSDAYVALAIHIREKHIAPETQRDT